MCVKRSWERGKIGLHVCIKRLTSFRMMREILTEMGEEEEKHFPSVRRLVAAFTVGEQVTKHEEALFMYRFTFLSPSRAT